MTIEIPLSQQGKHAGKYVAIVDECDADLADVRWSAQTPKQGYTTYALRSNRDYDISVWESMHVVILERMIERKLEKGEQVDHIDGNGLNNRRSNLRLSTHRQNQQNSRKRTKGTSQYKGVSHRKRNGKWQATIVVNGKQKLLGYYADELEAHLAYVEASRRLFGEFANSGGE